ncbi:MAG: trypsin-like peptidase domain-containing protein, partial [FCB group bacterium]|nr:trypsin-like peptidase domain-containing protein [FCB group bacterium]
MEDKVKRLMQKFSIFTLMAVTFILIGIIFASRMEWTDTTVAEVQTPIIPAKSVVNLGLTESPFIAVAEMVKPAVVSISSEMESTVPRMQDFFDRGPFRDFFEPRTPQKMQPRKAQSGGTGIIISSDGYILTNNHLAEKAAKITVTLADGDEYEAEIAGADPMTDVALLKIDKNLKPSQVAKLGDSDAIKIGQWAIAIGNPFGLDWTVTVGVISAKGRGGLNISGGGPDLQNFIQTDASINFGNSGGPLVNIRGEVIGINTAINTQGQGLGFAIPINMARQVVDQIKNEGKVSHGYLGMLPAPLTNAKKEALGLDKDVKGIFVDHVEPNTPADEGGLEPGDVIVELENEKIADVV